MLKSTKAHDLLKLPCATIEENAVVALHQLVLETKIKVLAWVLDSPEEETP